METLEFLEEFLSVVRIIAQKRWKFKTCKLPRHALYYWAHTKMPQVAQLCEYDSEGGFYGRKLAGAVQSKHIAK